MKTLLLFILGVSFLSLSVQASDLGKKDTECIWNKSDLSRSASARLNKTDAKKEESTKKIQNLNQ